MPLTQSSRRSLERHYGWLCTYSVLCTCLYTQAPKRFFFFSPLTPAHKKNSAGNNPHAHHYPAFALLPSSPYRYNSALAPNIGNLKRHTNKTKQCKMPPLRATPDAPASNGGRANPRHVYVLQITQHVLGSTVHQRTSMQTPGKRAVRQEH